MYTAEAYAYIDVLQQISTISFGKVLFSDHRIRKRKLVMEIIVIELSANYSVAWLKWILRHNYSELVKMEEVERALDRHQCCSRDSIIVTLCRMIATWPEFGWAFCEVDKK